MLLTSLLVVIALGHHTFASEVGFLPHVEDVASSAAKTYLPSPYPDWIVPAEAYLPMTAQVGDSQQKPILASPVSTSFANLPSKTVFRMPSATEVATWTERILCSDAGCGDMPRSELQYSLGGQSDSSYMHLPSLEALSACAVGALGCKCHAEHPF